MNFFPCFPHLLSDFGENKLDMYLHVMLLIICKFHENQYRRLYCPYGHR